MKKVLIFSIFVTFPFLASSQTCAIINPTSSQLIQTVSTLKLVGTVSSAPTAYKFIFSVDYQRWANGYAKDPHLTYTDYRDQWQGPWTVNWYSALNGDGPHVITGAIYDFLGNLLATCPTITFTVRVQGMSNQSINAMPTSGTGKWGFLTFNGSNANSTGNTFFVDGFPPIDGNCIGSGASGPTSQTGGWQIPNFNTTCFPNGPHLIYSGYYINSLYLNDPYLLGLTFTSSNVSGNVITVNNHYSYQGSIVTLTTTGTLPAPLNPGCAFEWQSNSNVTGTASYSIAGGIITVTTSVGCSFAPGVPVYLKNIHSNNSSTGVPLCDGYFKMLTGSGTTFTVIAPTACPNGISNNYNFEALIYPYWVNNLTVNTISLSATQGGSTVTLTNGGTGTHTVIQRISSHYYTQGGDDLAQHGGPAYVQALYTFSNSNAPMEIEVPFWEGHLTIPTTQSVCPKVKNTDLSFSTLSCSSFGYQEVDDGGISNVCSVSTSGIVTPISAGWCQIKVSCSACAAGSVSLPTVIVYIQVHSGSITFPHFRHDGGITNSFIPGFSFHPISAWQLNISNATPYNVNGIQPKWYGPMMNEANINSSIINPDPSNTSMGDPSNTSCYSGSWPSAYHAFEAGFASQYGTYFELDTESMQWGSNGQAFLAAFLNNFGFNRQSCYTGFLNQLIAEGRTWRTFSYDELNRYMAGEAPFRNPNLGSSNFPSIVVSGGVATYNVTESFAGSWNQAAGTGSWVKVSGAVTNTCLNGWFPVTSINAIAGISTVTTSISFITPSTCSSGTYTESTAQLYHYFVSSSNPGGENSTNLPRLVGVSNNNIQNWDSQFLQQVVVSACNGTSCLATFTMNSHKIASGQAIRVQGSSQLLNTVAPVTVIDTNHLSIQYFSLNGTLPAAGTYTSSNDSGLFVTVDGNLPPTPFLTLRNLYQSINPSIANTWSSIGLTYTSTNDPGIKNWQGSTVGADAAFPYNPNSPPNQIYGPDTSVYNMVGVANYPSGLTTRAYQLPARAMLVAGNTSYIQYCQNFTFNPACDHPQTLGWRPETMVAQIMGMETIGGRANRLYNFAGNMNDMYNLNCCGWNARGTGINNGINPQIMPKQWAAMARTNALIRLREDTELQPNANKPYYGPMFQTDAHTSATYGNQLTILGLCEMPYGSQTITLPQISGGTMLKYVLTGYSLSVTTLGGNPTTDTDEYCKTPGQTTTYIGLPAAPVVNPIDNLAFAPPATLPFGATYFFIQVGYYPRAMNDDPVTNCTTACSIGIDHHNTAAYYRVIYADMNKLPLSIGDPVKIPSQGLF